MVEQILLGRILTSPCPRRGRRGPKARAGRGATLDTRATPVRQLAASVYLSLTLSLDKERELRTTIRKPLPW